MSKLGYDAIMKITAFATGAVMSIAMLGFSFYKLSGDNVDPADKTIYIGICLSTLSLYVPSPIGLISGLVTKETTTPTLDLPMTIKDLPPTTNNQDTKISIV